MFEGKLLRQLNRAVTTARPTNFWWKLHLVLQLKFWKALGQLVLVKTVHQFEETKINTDHLSDFHIKLLIKPGTTVNSLLHILTDVIWELITVIQTQISQTLLVGGGGGGGGGGFACVMVITQKMDTDAKAGFHRKAPVYFTIFFGMRILLGLICSIFLARYLLSIFSQIIFFTKISDI